MQGVGFSVSQPEGWHNGEYDGNPLSSAIPPALMGRVPSTSFMCEGFSCRLYGDEQIAEQYCRLNFGVFGPVPHLASTYDVQAVLRGIAKRMRPKPMELENALFPQLRNFVRNQVRIHYRPLSMGDFYQRYLEYVDEWLEGTNYNGVRKHELRKCAQWINERLPEVRSCIRNFNRGKSSPLAKKIFNVKSFVKNEFTESEKEARIINSRSDYFKVLMGPLAKRMESVVYDLNNHLGKHFIKHVPVSDRPNYLKENVQKTDGTYYATDYSSFENSFGVKQQLALEQQLYKWLLHDNKELYEIFKVQLRPVTCKFRNLHVKTEVMRMSGEMTTSLGNGFSNLMLYKFMLLKNGLNPDISRGVVEGDDGLWWLPHDIDVSYVERLGFKLKLIKHTSVNTASFCGQLFDLNNNVVMANPYYYMASAGWACKTGLWNKEKCAMVTACKALSLTYQFAGCPVISALGKCMLRNSGWDKSKDILKEKLLGSSIDVYLKDRWLEAIGNEIDREISDSSRMFFCDLFGMPPSAQVELEKELSACSGWLLTNFTSLAGFPQSWLTNWHELVRPTQRTMISKYATVDDCGNIAYDLTLERQ